MNELDRSSRTCLDCGEHINPSRYTSSKFCPLGTDCRKERELNYKRLPIDNDRACVHCGDPIGQDRHFNATGCPNGTKCYRDRASARTRARYATNSAYRDRLKELAAARTKRPEVMESERARGRARWRNNPAYRKRVLESNRKSRSNRYSTDASYREKVNEYNRKHHILRYAKKLQACVNRQRNLCGICHKPLTGAIHLDHVLPASLGGPDTLDNLQATHAVCNMLKGARLAPGGLRLVNNEGER